MVRACIVRVASGEVVNVVEYASLPEGTPPGFPGGHIAVEHARADRTWRYEDGALAAPAAEPEAKSKQDRISEIEGQYPITQRALREAVIVLGDMDERIRQSPVYARAVAAEALIVPIRQE
jgi:hypothetical protein